MKNVHKYILAGIASTMVAAVGIGSYLAGKSASDTALQQLTEQLDSLRKGEQDAAVVRRVSQQMESIAYQQKAVSDKQRERAEEQSKLALENAQRAEQESRAARIAEGQALRSAEEAEHQRANAEAQQQIAVEQRNEATLAKNIADTLNYRSLARTLGTTSVLQREAGNTELADLLAYTSWYFLSKYKGNTYGTESFKALSAAIDKGHQATMHKRGAVNAISVVPQQRGGSMKEQCVAVTNYGEVELITATEKGLSNKALLHNTNFTFCDVWAGSKDIYALAVEGTLCVIGYDGSLKTIVLPTDKYKKLVRTDNNTLLIAGKRNVMWYTFSSGNLSSPVALPKELSTVVKRNDKAILFYADGSQAELDNTGRLKASTPFLRGNTVTTALYEKQHDCLYLGTTKGIVSPINKYDRQIETLDAHASKVADIAMVGTVLVSGGYDKCVYIWPMQNLLFESGLNFFEELGAASVTKGKATNNNITMGWIVPMEKVFDGWALAVESCNDGNNVWVGTSSGRVQRINVNVDNIAHTIEKSLTRNMTQSEWDRFVGTSIPYIKFK